MEKLSAKLFVNFLGLASIVILAGWLVAQNITNEDSTAYLKFDYPNDWEIHAIKLKDLLDQGIILNPNERIADAPFIASSGNIVIPRNPLRLDWEDIDNLNENSNVRIWNISQSDFDAIPEDSSTNRLLPSLFYRLGRGAGILATSADGKINAFKNEANNVYVAGGNMHLRNTAPYEVAGFYLKGQKVGVIRKDEHVRIIDSKKFEALWVSQNWVKIERLSEGALPKTGWVYNGGSDYFSLAESSADK